MDTLLKLLKSGDVQIVWNKYQALQADTYTQSLGVDAQLLRELAGKAVADKARQLAYLRELERIIIFVGPGNNGADAIVAARHFLAFGFNFLIYLTENEEKFASGLKEELALFKRVLEKIRPKSLEKTIRFLSDGLHEPPPKTLIIDALFGAGLNREPSGNGLLAINFINNFRQKFKTSIVLSVDIPSGLSFDAKAPSFAVFADHTITFGPMKLAHISEPSKSFCGVTSTRTIGLFSTTQNKFFYKEKQTTLNNLFLPSKKTSHKGSFGHVLIFEGHPFYLGASRLVARGALRAGAGLTTIVTKDPDPKAFDFAEVMKISCDALSSDFLEKINAVVIGPGLSKQKAQQERALRFIKHLKDFELTLVIDADGLELLKKSTADLAHKIIIATPHPKEAADLLALTTQDIENDRFWAINTLGKLYDLQIIWVLKGATTLVRSLSGEIFAFKGDLPLLSSGGSGDILSGAIAGLVKQTASPLAATLLAVSMQIESAKLLSKSVFRGILASELSDFFPKVRKERLNSDDRD